ncbi:macrophage mannose receptor 1 [Nephila pilipes]|uniref:Macrophage mannose receptor 1 n=1 Tax=Nephila pilipes TaxID=299642 RepID=A0A8X6T8W2_NEPPI|nr:macrophage mannose receptor 1 [Nephila pilipes]
MFIQDIQTVGVPDLDNLDNVNLTKRLRYQQRLRNNPRKRFREEYLSLLVLEQINEAGSKQVEVRDVVLVGCDNKESLDWPMGLVIEIFPGKDNSVRVVRVKISKGELIRPVKRLYSLELNSDCKIYNSELLKHIKDNHSKIKNCNNQKDNANLGKTKEKNRTKIVKTKCDRNVIKRYDN